MNRHVKLSIGLSSQKPNTIKDTSVPCPFCDRKRLLMENKLLAEDGPRLHIENKYPTLSRAYQTVYVEDDSCADSLATYPHGKLGSVLAFGMKRWFEMSEDPRFQSVLFLKNHGFYSGGSIAHAHMQLVGLEDIDYRASVNPEFFIGEPIHAEHGMEWNISTHPRSEFYEFNVSLPKQEVLAFLTTRTNPAFEAFCRAVQQTVQYILAELNPTFQSYNIAFYEHEDRIIAKLFSRGHGNGTVNSAFYLGYDIAQVPGNLRALAEDIRARRKK